VLVTFLIAKMRDDRLSTFTKVQVNDFAIASLFALDVSNPALLSALVTWKPTQHIKLRFKAERMPTTHQPFYVGKL